MESVKSETRPEMVARYLVEIYFPGLKPRTLANLNCQGKGPKPFKRGKIVFYDFEDLGKFVRGEVTG